MHLAETHASDELKYVLPGPAEVLTQLMEPALRAGRVEQPDLSGIRKYNGHK